MDLKPVGELLQSEGAVGVVAAIAGRMADLGLLSAEAAAVEPAVLARNVVAESDICKVIAGCATNSVLLTSVVKVTDAVADGVSRVAAETVVPAATRAGKSAFKATRDMLGRMNKKAERMICPECGAKAVMRINRATGMPFLACSAWRQTGCNWTAKLVIEKVAE